VEGYNVIRIGRMLVGLAVGALLLAGGKPPHSLAQANSFQGSTKGTQGPVSLHAGLAIVRARSNGTGNFTVSLATQDPGATVANSYNNRYLMVDSVGAYNGAAAALLTQDGSYFFDVTQASGPYQLSVEQPSPSTAQPVNQTSFSGKGQQVTSAFTLQPGTYTISAQNDSSTLRVRLYSIDDLGGGAVVSPDTGYYGDELIDSTIPPGLMSVSITVPSAGVDVNGNPIPGTYIFYVDPEGTGPGNWKISAQ
jgi:hypothetical protein